VHRDALAVIDLAVVVNDEGLGQHGLKGGSEAALGAPGEVVSVIVAFGPLDQPGDVIGVALVAQVANGLAAVVLEAPARAPRANSRPRDHPVVCTQKVLPEPGLTNVPATLSSPVRSGFPLRRAALSHRLVKSQGELAKRHGRPIRLAERLPGVAGDAQAAEVDPER
jgi:hypothetical protein